MSKLKLSAVSIDDEDGVKTTVPADHVLIYSTIKTDQLRVLNKIIADHTGGFNVKLDENAISALASLANEIASICNEFMCSFTVAIDVALLDAPKKGGA